MASQLKCEVLNRVTGAKRVYDLKNTGADWPKWVGSSPECEIRIDDPAMAPKQLKLMAGGRHFMIEPMKGLEARTRDMPVSPLTIERVDEYGFELGHFAIKVYFDES